MTDVVVGRFTGPAFALLRIISGLMFLCHGTQKLLGWPPSEMKGPLPLLPYVGGWIELVGGFLIMIGLLTGIAAFICSGEMAVAYWGFHVANGGLIPLVNKGEPAVLYCFVFLFIAAPGAGIWSVDSIVRKRTPLTASTGAARV